jgi:hypothetical protein
LRLLTTFFSSSRSVAKHLFERRRKTRQKTWASSRIYWQLKDGDRGRGWRAKQQLQRRTEPCDARLSCNPSTRIIGEREVFFCTRRNLSNNSLISRAGGRCQRRRSSLIRLTVDGLFKESFGLRMSHNEMKFAPSLSLSRRL